MIAVIDAPPSMPTRANWSFIALAIYIIQPNWTTSSSKSGRPWSTNSARIPELMANNTCIIYIPVIITNCSPLDIIKYFDSSFPAARSSDQSQCRNNFQENMTLSSNTTLNLPIYKHVWINAFPWFGFELRIPCKIKLLYNCRFLGFWGLIEPNTYM